MVSTIPEFQPVVGKAFVLCISSGKSIRLSPACVCRFFFLERGCVRSNWQERPVHGHPRFGHDLDSILPGPQCSSNRLISRWKDGSKKTRSLQKGFQPFLWPRKFVQAGNSLKKKASVYNPTTSKRPRVRHLSRKVFRRVFASVTFRVAKLTHRR